MNTQEEDKENEKKKIIIIKNSRNMIKKTQIKSKMKTWLMQIRGK